LITSITISAQNQKINFSKVDSIIENAIIDHAFPGAQLLIWKDGKTIYEKPFGHFTYDKNSPKVTNSTLFDLASVTKVIATTTAAMICYDRKLFSLDDPVVKYIPEFGVNGKDKITIKNLLLHNSGLPAFKKFYEFCSSADDVLKDIYSSKLEYPTGEKMVYSDLGIITLAKIIEKVTGKRFDKFCKDEIFTPLKMKSTLFNPPDSLKKFCAPTEVDNYWRNRLLQGEVHDEASAMLNGVAGHAGLFSTASDIAKLMSVLINNGMNDGKSFINPETVKLFTKRFSEQSSRALGWDTKSETGSSAGNYFSNDSYGHTGYTGTSVWTDPKKNLIVIFLTNRVYPTRNNTKIIKIRPALHDEIIKAISE
jgi:CubicO group peptidase (beta-lactamase class C family)